MKTLLLQETRLSVGHGNDSNAFFSKKSSGAFKHRCHKCGEIGHMARDCTEKRSESARDYVNRNDSKSNCSDKVVNPGFWPGC